MNQVIKLLEQEFEKEMKLLQESICKLHMRNENERINVLKNEYALITEINNLTSRPVFQRAFSRNEIADLRNKIEGMCMSVGKSSENLKLLFNQINNKIENQKKLEKRLLKHMFADSQTEYKKYEKLIESDTFLNYIADNKNIRK